VNVCQPLLAKVHHSPTTTPKNKEISEWRSWRSAIRLSPSSGVGLCAKQRDFCETRQKFRTKKLELHFSWYGWFKIKQA
jgi:hypothetical protein